MRQSPANRREEGGPDGAPPAPLARRVLYTAFAVAAAIYFSWRLTVFNPDARLFSALFYAAELLAMFQIFMIASFGLRRRRRPWRPAPPGLSVDAFITTYNESLDVVRRTVVAALAMRYPHQTWLLDDGNRAEMRDLASELGCRYLARTQNLGAKAGNLNHALRHGRGDFVALFDADHAPQPDFLDRLLGYFSDPKLCFVQTPQDYFNLDAFQFSGRGKGRLIWHDQSPFHHTQQPRRDRLNAATLCGCSAVLRRAHLDAIGGFPTETVTEDMHAAVKLQKLGFASAYHPEPLAFGIAPVDFFGYIRQRLRWGEGNMQVCRIERLPFGKGLTRQQNFAYTVLALLYAEAWPRLVLCVAPIFTLLFGVPPFISSAAPFFLICVPYILLALWALEEVSDGYGRVFASDRYGMARLAAGLGAATGLFRRRIRFRVTSKSLRGSVPWLLALPQIALFLLGAAAILTAVVRETYRHGAGLPPLLTRPVLVAVSALVCYQAAVAFQVLRGIFAAGRHHTDHYVHRLALPLILRRGSETARVYTTGLSLLGATLAAPLPPGSHWRVVVPLPEGEATASAKVGADGATLSFGWASLAARDVLDQSLHARRWTRTLLGQTERQPTPLEWLGLVQAPTPDALPGWQAVLVECPEQATPRLGLLRRSDNRHWQAVFFGAAPSATMTLVAAEDKGLMGCALRLARSEQPVGSGLACMDGAYYSAEPLPGASAAAGRARRAVGLVPAAAAKGL